MDQDRGSWWALANAIRNNLDNKMERISGLAEGLLVCQERLCSMEFVT